MPRPKVVQTLKIRGRPPADPNSPTPMPFAAFAAAVVGTSHEVWTTLLRQSHGREARSYKDWMALIQRHGASQG